MSSQDPYVSEVPKDCTTASEIGNFSHIASDEKTLKSLIRYTQKLARSGGVLFLDHLEEISAIVLMVIFRHGCAIEHLHLSSLKTLDLACAKMLVKAVKHGETSWITFGPNFDLSNISPEVISEFSTISYGWNINGCLALFSEKFYWETESEGGLL